MVGISFPGFRFHPGNGLPSRLLFLPFEEHVKGLPIHPGLARGGAEVSPTTVQHGLGVLELKTGQVLFSRIFPWKR